MINRIEDISKENAQYFISSLIDIGDMLGMESKWIFNDKRTYLSRILHDLLKKYSHNKERHDVLKEAISNSQNSLYVAVDLLSDQDFIYNRFDYENDRKSIDEALIDENDLMELEDLMVDKIRSWDENGKLWEHSNLSEIIYCWKNWDEDDYIDDKLVKMGLK